MKNFCDDLFFFGEHLRLCPWSLVLASSIPVLGLESVCPRKGCPWPWHRIFFVSLALASSLVPSTPPLPLILVEFTTIILQSHYLAEVESRTQGLRPRTQKKSDAKAKDSLSEGRHSQGQGQECLRPRPRTKYTSASALQKKGLHKNFSSDLHKKNVFQKIFQALHEILTIKKIVLSSSRGQANFRELEASRPRPRT